MDSSPEPAAQSRTTSRRLRVVSVIIGLLLLALAGGAIAYRLHNGQKNQELSFAFSEADIAQTRKLYIDSDAEGPRPTTLTLTDNQNNMVTQKTADHAFELLARLHGDSFLLQEVREGSEEPSRFWVMYSDGRFQEVASANSSLLREAESQLFPISENSVIFEHCAQSECKLTSLNVTNDQSQQINFADALTKKYAAARLSGVSTDGAYAYFIHTEVTSRVKSYEVHAHDFLAYDIKQAAVVQEKRLTNTGSLSDPSTKDQAHRGQFRWVSPDGRFIAYMRDGSYVIHAIASDSAARVYRFDQDMLITEDWVAWSPDSKRLVFPASSKQHGDLLIYIDISSDSHKEITGIKRDAFTAAAWADFGTMHYGKSLSGSYPGAKDIIPNLEYDAATNTTIASPEDYGLLMVPRVEPRYEAPARF